MKNLPFLPAGKVINYVRADNEFMAAAQKVAETASLDKKHPIGAVLVKDGIIIGQGANGARFHKFLGCVRKLFKVPTGKGYWLCPGCQPRHHAEPSALKNAYQQGHQVAGADLYLWGHWWCCESCWQKMIKADIKKVYLVEDAQQQFGV